MPAYASSAKIASAEAKLGGPIALDSSILLRQLVVALGNVTDQVGTGDVVGPSSSTDSAVASFDGATGKLLKNTTVKIGTGTVVLPGSVSGTATIQAPAVAGTALITTPSVTGTLAIIGNPLSQFASTTSSQLAGVISDETGSGALMFGTDPVITVSSPSTTSAGYLGVPQNSQSAAYTTVLTDAGKQIYHPSADTTARTWTIAANASVAYPIGAAITFINDTSAGVITIAINSDTLVLAGAGTTGSRTLAASGMATAIKMTSTRWIISGTNLT